MQSAPGNSWGHQTCLSAVSIKRKKEIILLMGVDTPQRGKGICLVLCQVTHLRLKGGHGKGLELELSDLLAATSAVCLHPSTVIVGIVLVRC